ncbi:MAG: class I SAM-dependent methyltransferase [Candidatus Marinimicrobia bacterium]|nr:class I SAM-dependent methyltransferase [Candidatus Neomarinimicrobiota bacterium]
MKLGHSVRKDREMAFHNRTFSTGTREQAAKYYSNFTSSRVFFMHELRHRVPDQAILEFGCGTGSLAVELAGKGAQMTGIDLSEVAIEQARNKAERADVTDRSTFHVMDAEDLTFPEESFDMVCGAGILHHLDVERVLGEIYRVLKREGVAIFLEPLGHNPFINLYRKFTPSLRTVDEHPLRQKDLKFIETRFASSEFYYFHLFSLLAIPLRGLPGFEYLVKKLDRIDRFVFARLPWLRKEAWIVVMILSKSREALPLKD